MTINHINLVVSNVAATRNLFETNFGFKCTSQKGENAIAVLENQENFILVLMADKQGNVMYPLHFHIGFLMKTPQAVTDMYLKLKENGVQLETQPGKIRNSFAFYFRFDTFMMEVGTREEDNLSS